MLYLCGLTEIILTFFTDFVLNYPLEHRRKYISYQNNTVTEGVLTSIIKWYSKVETDKFPSSVFQVVRPTVSAFPFTLLPANATSVRLVIETRKQTQVAAGRCFARHPPLAQISASGSSQNCRTPNRLYGEPLSRCPFIDIAIHFDFKGLEELRGSKHRVAIAFMRARA